MKRNAPYVGSALRGVCTVSIAALVAAAALSASPTQSVAAGFERPIASVVEKRVEAILPALVTISTTRSDTSSGGLSLVPDNDLLGEFFHRFGDGNAFPDFPFRHEDRDEAVETVTGAGIVIDGDGLIVTASDLVSSAERIQVTTYEGEKIAAEVVGQDTVTGLAVLRVDSADVLTDIAWSDENLAIGQHVYSIGLNMEHGPLLSAGLVASASDDGLFLLDDQTSSLFLGAPVIDEDGRILAIRTRISDPSTDMVVAVGGNVAKDIVAELGERGAVARGYLGVSIQPVTPDLASALGLENAAGAIVADVQDGTPAEAAGLKTGDVILMLDDQKIETPAALSRAVGSRDPEDEVRLTVLRDGEELGIDVTLAAVPGSETTSFSISGTSVPELGVSLQTLTAELREAFGLSDDVTGLVVTEVDETAGDGLQTGDVIVSAYRDPIESVDDLTAAAEMAREEGRSTILFLVDRGGARIFVPVPLSTS